MQLRTLALAALIASSSACYGSYATFGKLHTWNGKATHDKWANSAIHLGLWIVPVYELAIVADFLVFNTVEHLTGSNPMR